VNNNWFEIEQVMRSRQQDLLREAADLRRAETIRTGRTIRGRTMRAARKEGATGAGTPVSPSGLTLAARVGGILVAIGTRLQRTSKLAEDAATCGVCGKHFQGLGPVSRA
jgi:hypothetical protein